MNEVIPPRRLILHVGQAKAGSTAIQNYLEAQREVLLCEGILFPKSYFLRRNPFDPSRSPGHIGLIAAAKNSDLSELEHEFQESSAHIVVMSCENLFADQPEATLQQIAHHLAGWDIQLIVVLRHPQRWIVSRYVEEIMSGNKLGEQTLVEFINAKPEWLLYGDRLDMLVRCFFPIRMQLLNYDAEAVGGGLIPAFLAAAGLPTADSCGFAKAIQANLREKEVFLVEVKRRLNVVLPRMPLQIRQEFETLIREHGRLIAASAPLLATEMPSAVQLPTSMELAVTRSNHRLVGEFGFVPPFDPIDAAPVDARLHRRSLAGDVKLTLFGLKVASQLLRRVSAGHYVSWLATPGSELLVDLVAQSSVSLHLESPETALWAACLCGKLPILFSDCCTVSDFDRLMSLKLPSDVITLDSSISLRPMLRGRSIDLMVVAQDVSTVQIQQLWQFAGSAAKIVMIDPNIDVAEMVAEELGLTCTALLGCIRVLAPPGT